ncbi:MAG: mechanosensitive ion channel family protein [Gemmatimonadetes bacterium]|nr:mechanosensitive ion channel family protein [Gemmatimonadota bacterium]
MTRRLPILTAAAVGILLLTLVSIPPMAAQEQESEAEQALAGATPEQVGERAAALLARLAATRAQTRVYRDRLAAASAEDSLVLRIQLANSRDRFLESLHELADMVVVSDQDTVPGGLRDRVETVFTEVTPVVWEVIGELRTEIDGLRALRSGTAPADRSGLEDQIAVLTSRLDRYYTLGRDHIQKLEALGQDTVEPRATFTGLLAARADELSGRLDLAILRVGELDTRLREIPGDPDATALLASTHKDLGVNATSQRTVLDLMDGMGMPTEEYRAQLVIATQDLASGLSDAKVAAALARRAWGRVTSWLAESGPTALVKLLIVVLILLAGRFLALLARRVVEKSLEKAKLDVSELLRRMVIQTTHTAIIVLTVLVALAQLGITLGPMLAGFGVIGLILGFAMQDSLSNLAAGMMILINRPYDTGDVVEISGVLGRVEHMSMVSTRLLTLDNQRLEVPNSKVWSDVIKNLTDQKVRRVDLVFGISYSDDIPHAERVLNEILAENEFVLDDPEPVVRVHALGESSVDFVVRPWVKTADYWEVHWDVTKAVKMRFDEEGISIPFPQRDVRYYPLNAEHQSEMVEDIPHHSTGAEQDADEIAGDER